MALPKVYVPQEQTRWDNAIGSNVPKMDFTPALKYGEIVVCLPHNISFYVTAPVVAALKEKLRDFTEDDYLISVGSPLVIGISTHIALCKTGGKVNLLTWDKLQREYLCHRVSM